MNLARDIKPYRTVLVILPIKDYNMAVIKISREFRQKNVCFITLNKTYDSLSESFAKNKVATKNFTFIDAITNTFKKTTPKKGNCYFVSSPAALTEMSILLTKVLSEKFDVVIFDSLTTSSPSTRSRRSRDSSPTLSTRSGRAIPARSSSPSPSQSRNRLSSRPACTSRRWSSTSETP